MATQDARSTSLAEFDVDPGVVAGGHDPSLHPGERFVRCRTCGVTVPYAVTAEGPIRQALAELGTVTCGRFERPDATVGDHLATITPGDGAHGRTVVCESCGRAAPLGDDRERVLADLSSVPCVDGLSYPELVGAVFSPDSFTPSLADLGIEHWSGRPGRRHGEGVRRVFRHDRFQFTVSVRRTDDGSHAATVTTSPAAAGEPLAELRFPSDDPGDPATRENAATLLTFLAATDPLTAGEFASLKDRYDEAFEEARARWLDAAYRRAREKFARRLGGSPEAFSETFPEGADSPREVLRRTIGSGGFDDPGAEDFARELLGRDLEFPAFVPFVADSFDRSLQVCTASS